MHLDRSTRTPQQQNYLLETAYTWCAALIHVNPRTHTGMLHQSIPSRPHRNNPVSPWLSSYQARTLGIRDHPDLHPGQLDDFGDGRVRAHVRGFGPGNQGCATAGASTCANVVSEGRERV